MVVEMVSAIWLGFSVSLPLMTYFLHSFRSASLSAPKIASHVSAVAPKVAVNKSGLWKSSDVANVPVAATSLRAHRSGPDRGCNRRGRLVNGRRRFKYTCVASLVVTALA